MLNIFTGGALYAIYMGVCPTLIFFMFPCPYQHNDMCLILLRQQGRAQHL